MSSTKRKEQQRIYAAKRRAKLAEQNVVVYNRMIKKEFHCLMDAKLAELNKTGV